jgi:hypothetical protein
MNLTVAFGARSLSAKRVCRAWHEAGEVEVLLPGCYRAEGQRKNDEGQRVRPLYSRLPSAIIFPWPDRLVWNLLARYVIRE